MDLFAAKYELPAEPYLFHSDFPMPEKPQERFSQSWNLCDFLGVFVLISFGTDKTILLFNFIRVYLKTGNKYKHFYHLYQACLTIDILHSYHAWKREKC